VADSVSKQPGESFECKQDAPEGRRRAKRQRLVLNLYQLLQQANENDMDEPSLAAHLSHIRNEPELRLVAIEKHAAGKTADEHQDGTVEEEHDVDEDVESTMVNLVE
jgi:hypothetical protein